MSKTVRRPGGRSARVRSAVHAAALQEIAESGLGRISMESIARRAGVNKTTLYRRWGDWETLLTDAMLAHAEAEVPVLDEGSLREDLLALARRIATDTRRTETQAVIRAVAGQAGASAALRKAQRRFWKERFTLDEAIVDRAIARGEVSPDVDAKTVIEAVLGPLYFRLLVSAERIDDAFLNRVVDLAVAGATAARKHAEWTNDRVMGGGRRA